MKKILFTILCLVCFLGTAHAQNPTLVRGTNITSGIIIGGPMGNVYVNSGFSNSHIGIAEHILKGNWVSTGTLNLSGNQILNVGTATLGTNAVNLTQMNSAIASATNGVGGQFINNLNGTGTNTTFVTSLLSLGLTTISNQLNVSGNSGRILISNTNEFGPGLFVITNVTPSSAMTTILKIHSTTASRTLTLNADGSGDYNLIQDASRTIRIGANNGANLNLRSSTINFEGASATDMVVTDGTITFGRSSGGNTLLSYNSITNSHPNGRVVNGPTQTVNPITTFSSNVTHSAATTLGPSGTIFTNVVSATASLDFGNLVVGASEDLTIAVTGAKANDSVILGRPAGENASLFTRGFVSVPGTVTVRAGNAGTLAVDQGALTYRVTVIEH